MYTHIVFFKLIDPSNENIQRFKEVLESMEGNIQELQELEVGVDDVRSERSYDVSIYTKFKTKEDYLAYDVSEYHVEKVKKVVRPYIESSKSMDYYSK